MRVAIPPVGAAGGYSPLYSALSLSPSALSLAFPRSPSPLWAPRFRSASLRSPRGGALPLQSLNFWDYYRLLVTRAACRGRPSPRHWVAGRRCRPSPENGAAADVLGRRALGVDMPQVLASPDVLPILTSPPGSVRGRPSPRHEVAGRRCRPSPENGAAAVVLGRPFFGVRFANSLALRGVALRNARRRKCRPAAARKTAALPLFRPSGAFSWFRWPSIRAQKKRPCVGRLVSLVWFFYF